MYRNTFQPPASTRWDRFKQAAGIGIPFYVTRASADGQIAKWTVNAWVAMAILFLIFANLLLWGVVGVITALGVLF